MASLVQSLREARQFKENRQERQQLADASANSPHPVAPEVTHAEAVFPSVLPSEGNIAQRTKGSSAVDVFAQQ